MCGQKSQKNSVQSVRKNTVVQTPAGGGVRTPSSGPGEGPTPHLTANQSANENRHCWKLCFCKTALFRGGGGRKWREERVRITIFNFTSRQKWKKMKRGNDRKMMAKIDSEGQIVEIANALQKMVVGFPSRGNTGPGGYWGQPWPLGGAPRAGLVVALKAVETRVLSATYPGVSSPVETGESSGRPWVTTRALQSCPGGPSQFPRKGLGISGGGLPQRGGGCPTLVQKFWPKTTKKSRLRGFLFWKIHQICTKFHLLGEFPGEKVLVLEGPGLPPLGGWGDGPTPFPPSAKTPLT